jgi:tRNA G10  N-methylase Trm11
MPYTTHSWEKKPKGTISIFVNCIYEIFIKNLGTPSLSSQTTIRFTVISRNEHPPICDINNNNNNISWSIMENSQIGTIIGIISCHDDDQDELNGKISVDSQWFLDEKIDDQTKHIIPFEITTKKSNISEVINSFKKKEQTINSFFFLVNNIRDYISKWFNRS